MIAPANIREDTYGVTPEYDETIRCDKCGYLIEYNAKGLPVMGGEYICEDCMNEFDIDDVLSATGYNSVSELLNALCVTEYIN